MSQAQRWEVLLGTGRVEQAAAEIGRTLAADPDNPEILCYLSRSLLLLKRLPEAEQYSRRALAVAPQHEWALRLTAAALSARGRHGEAAMLAQEAARLNPLLAVGWTALSGVLLRGNRGMAALGAAKHAAEVEPDHTPALLAMASAYVKLQDRQRAIAVLGLILRSSPDEPAAVELLRRLDPKGRRRQVGAITADILADPAARQALRSGPAPDLGDLAGRLPEMVPLRLGRRGRVDDRALVEAMVRAGDPDARRWLGARLWMLLLYLGLALTFVGLGTQDVQGRSNTPFARLVAVAVVTIAVVTPMLVPLLRRHPVGLIDQVLKAPGTASRSVTVTILLVSAVVTVVMPGGAGTDDPPAGGLLALLALLVVVFALVRRETADYQRMMPSGRVLIAGFRSVRRVLTTALLSTTLVGAVVAGSANTSDELPSAFVAGAAGAFAVVVGAVVLIERRRDPAVRGAALALARQRMRVTTGVTPATLVAVLVAAALPEPVGVPVAIGALMVALFFLILLWVAGAARYVPGLNPNERARRR